MKWPFTILSVLAFLLGAPLYAPPHAAPPSQPLPDSPKYRLADSNN
jgi:hypothetical protein